MQSLKWFRPASCLRDAKFLSTARPRRSRPQINYTARPRHPQPQLNYTEQIRDLIDREPHRSPLGVIFDRMKQAYPQRIAPLSEFTSLFDSLVHLNRTRDAKMVFMRMRKVGYTTSASVEARVVMMLIEDCHPDEADTAHQHELIERLEYIVGDENFSEKDMHELVRLAAARDIDKKFAWFAVDAFRTGKGDGYVPALDLLPVAVEAAVSRGAVDEAFAMLDKAGVALKEDEEMTDHASRRVPIKQSIRRNLVGDVPFKSRDATRKSLRVAYGSLLTSLRDTGAWNADIYIVYRALQGLQAAGVSPDTSILNLVMMQAVQIKRYTTLLPIYKEMQEYGLSKGQWPDEHTYNVLFFLWGSLEANPSTEEKFRSMTPRTLFRNLLEATDPLYLKSLIASTSASSTTPPTMPKPLKLSEKHLRRALGAFLFQQDYAGAYIALTYLTSPAAGLTLEAWHTLYYYVVHHLVRRVFSQPPGPFGEARWTEGFLGTSLRGGKSSCEHEDRRSVPGSVGMKGGAGEKVRGPVGSVRLPLNAQTTNYMLEVIARREWSVVDPLYPPPGELPADRTHLFYPLASSSSSAAASASASAKSGPASPKSQRTSSHPTPTPTPPPTKTSKNKTHDFQYSVPSMFMMEHVDPPDLPPEFVWSVEPLQRLLVRAMYADEVLARRVAGGRAVVDRPLEMEAWEREACVGNVERRLREAREEMLPRKRQRAAVTVRVE